MIMLFVKLADAPSLSTIVFTRFVVGAPLLLWLYSREKRGNLQNLLSFSGLKKHLVRSFAGIGALYAAYFSVRNLPLVNAVTLSSTSPLFLPLIYLFWSRILVSKKRFFAAGLGFLGVCVMLRPSPGALFVSGSLLAIAAGFLRAVTVLNVRSLIRTESPLEILVYYFLTGIAFTWIPMVFDYNPVTNPLQWLYLFATAVAAIVYQPALVYACRHLPATKVSVISYFGVLTAGILGWLIFGEIPHLWVYIGSSLIIIGALISLFDPTESKRV